MLKQGRKNVQIARKKGRETERKTGRRERENKDRPLSLFLFISLSNPIRNSQHNLHNDADDDDGGRARPNVYVKCAFCSNPTLTRGELFPSNSKRSPELRDGVFPLPRSRPFVSHENIALVQERWRYNVSKACAIYQVDMSVHLRKGEATISCHSTRTGNLSVGELKHLRTAAVDQPKQYEGRATKLPTWLPNLFKKKTHISQKEKGNRNGLKNTHISTRCPSRHPEKGRERVCVSKGNTTLPNRLSTHRPSKVLQIPISQVPQRRRMPGMSKVVR
jgi:hypothetical protein